jgi:hypothetical protein
LKENEDNAIKTGMESTKRNRHDKTVHMEMNKNDLHKKMD